jgi:hypothetical protein
MAYANFGLGIVTAIVLAFEGRLSPGIAIGAGAAVFVALTLALFHPIARWIVAVLGTLMAAAYCGAIGWFLGGLSTGWGVLAGVAGAVIAGASYRSFMRKERETSPPL